MAQCMEVVKQSSPTLGLDSLAQAAASAEEGEIIEEQEQQEQASSAAQEPKRITLTSSLPLLSVHQQQLLSAQQEQVSAVRGKSAPPSPSMTSYRYGKKGYPYGPYGRGNKAHPFGKKSIAYPSDSDTESTSSSSSSSESEDDSGSDSDDDKKKKKPRIQPSVKAVLRGPSKGVTVQQKKKAPVLGSSSSSSTAAATAVAAAAAAKAKPKVKSPAPVAKQSKAKPAPYLRRLRVADIKKKKPSEAQKKRTATAPAEGQPSAKRAKSKKSTTPTTTSEPDAMHDSDTKSLETHPVVLYLRRHTPVKPCGRCAECRRPPCGKCSSCRKNSHLTERSRARERCTANGCTKLTEEELDRYRRAYNSAYTVDVIERELRAIRAEFMSIQERSSSSSSAGVAAAAKAKPFGAKPSDAPAIKKLQELQQRQAGLIARLQALNDEDPVLIQQTPEGYECFLLSIQTLETERDRIARFVERRACRDPPNIMGSRRQLRDFYGRKICYMTRLFANDMVARPYVSKLIEIADEHEKFINSFPQTEP